jgi:hypothetical protein
MQTFAHNLSKPFHEVWSLWLAWMWGLEFTAKCVGIVALPFPSSFLSFSHEHNMVEHCRLCCVAHPEWHPHLPTYVWDTYFSWMIQPALTTWCWCCRVHEQRNNGVLRLQTRPRSGWLVDMSAASRRTLVADTNDASRQPFGRSFSRFLLWSF